MFEYIKSIILILLALSIFLCSCAVQEKKVEYYYSIPTLSYLREGPAYDCQVVTEIYNADKVKFLEKNDAGWWQVQSDRDQKIGWTQPDLLSEIPLTTKNYYIVADELPLRDSPNEDIVSRKLLDYGDEVQKIAEKNGWWRVLVEKDKSIGWIPAKLASATRPVPPEISAPAAPGAPETQRPAPPAYYFVAAENLKLYLIPSIPSQVVKVLKLNDKVEKISQSGSTWIKVRYLNTGVEGWAFARYFRETPVTEKKQIVTEKKKSLKKGRQIQGPNAASLEPEGM